MTDWRRGQRLVWVRRSLFFDALSPTRLFEGLCGRRPGCFLLESALQGRWSRYSFLGLDNFGELIDAGQGSLWRSKHPENAIFGGPCPRDSLAAIQALLKRLAEEQDSSLPLHSGLVGFLGWETIRQLESFGYAPPNLDNHPIASLMLTRKVLVIDHRLGLVYLVLSALRDGQEGEAVWHKLQEELDSLQASLAGIRDQVPERIDYSAETAFNSHLNLDQMTRAITAGKEHIAKGDVFQVVLSQRFIAECPARPLDVYRVLRLLNPSPYMFFLQLSDLQSLPYWVVGASPEALVTLSDRRVTACPIAGSRPRGQTRLEDEGLSNELLADEKEMAEHAMLVDLMRNDLSRVCRANTVRVDKFMQVGRFSHVMHLYSIVTGELGLDEDAVSLLRAVFPAGTLSGTPKIRALEIIDRLETHRRGLYGGVVGYFSLTGQTDLAIAIRCAVIAAGRAYVQAGAGIVADSVIATEIQETRHKAAACLRAIAVANTISPL